MEREEIEKLNNELEQIIELESTLDNINKGGMNKWWKIKTPDIECSMFCKGTRERFKDFIKSEIEILKKDISLED